MTWNPAHIVSWAATRLAWWAFRKSEARRVKKEDDDWKPEYWRDARDKRKGDDE